MDLAARIEKDALAAPDGVARDSVFRLMRVSRMALVKDLRIAAAKYGEKEGLLHA